MKMRFLCLAILLSFVSNAALAQYWGGGYYDNRASTVGEGHARGISDIVRSQGIFNLATSEAAINMTQAQSNYIDNRAKATNTYFEMRQTNKAYRAAERLPRPSHETLVRFAQAGKPNPLSPSQLNTVSGNVSWPILLQDDRYANYRAQIEELFAKRAYNGGVTTDEYWAIDKTTKAMLAELKGTVREVPPQSYTAAKTFLQSLAHEGKQPPS